MQGKSKVAREFGSLYSMEPAQCAPVAQLDRAFDYESKGRKFESCRAHHKIKDLQVHAEKQKPKKVT